ncbi:hypothetical protein ME763_31915 [Streptomyces murinus]|uniref:hypothetical protein n=1 Tax=Streptomyces murinus TaxID=33900 RepID=UPI000A1D7FE9|nr:hypothetical protein [Streptomyces murinus]WDO09898.1 hypothetical protein ME763_31915 [Streptomyces murinus]
MSARTLDYRGVIVEPGWLTRTSRHELRELAEQFPVGARIVHACGRGGIVALDQPEHVPGVFAGGPTAVCLSQGGEPMVFAHWENDCGLTWGVWVRADKIRRSAPRAANRPGNKARIGGR